MQHGPKQTILLSIRQNSLLFYNADCLFKVSLTAFHLVDISGILLQTFFFLSWMTDNRLGGAILTAMICNTFCVGSAASSSSATSDTE